MIDEVLVSYERWRRKKNFSPKGTLLLGDLVIADRTGATNTFSMEIFVPKKFPSPGVHPRAKVLRHNLGKELSSDAHVEPDGALCLQLQQRNEIDYAALGLVGFMDHVVLHLHRARIWALVGPPFPGPEYGHGEVGRREFAAELPQLLAPYEALRADLPTAVAALVDPLVALPTRSICPCGSGTRFTDCHGPIVVERRARWAELGPAPRPLNETLAK